MSASRHRSRSTAGNVIDLVGFNERATLRDALSQVLAKSDDEKQAFLETFDTFFAFDQFKEKPQSLNPPAANENDERQQDEAEGGEGQEGEGGQSAEAAWTIIAGWRRFRRRAAGRRGAATA